MVKTLRNWRLASRWRHTVAAAAVTLLGLHSAQAQVDTYTFAASTGTYTQLAGGTNVANIQTDDAISASIPLGFSFTFDGTVYTQVRASSNGFLSFNPTASASTTTNDLDLGSASIRPLVAPLWDDLDGVSGTASYATTGTAPNRVFTFEWRNWEWRYTATAPGISFQARLYEGSNRVEFVYRQEAGALDSPTASIGLSGIGTGAGSFLSLSDATAAPTASSTTESSSIDTKPATGQIYAFTPTPPSPCPAVRTLGVGSITSTGAQVTFTPSASATSYTVTYTRQGGTPVVVTPAPTASPVTLTGLTPGTQYTVTVVSNCGGGLTSTAATATFTTTPPPPANDNCAGATALTAGANCTPVQGSVQSATPSASVPACSLTSPGTADDDVWYSFVATSTGHDITVDELPGLDAVVQVFRGGCGSLTALDCVDRSFTGGSETVRIAGLTVGQTYYVRVYSFSATPPTAADGAFTICVTNAPTAPANDECAGAINVPVQFGNACVNPVTGTNAAATGSASAPAPSCANYQGGDVWFRVVVPASGSVSFATGAGSNISDTGMSVYSGACGTLTELDCDDDGSGLFSLISLTGRTPGEVLYVRVWEYGNDTEGTFTLCVRAPSNCQTPTAPQASNITGSTADLTWAVGTPRPGATFTVEYGPRNFTLGSGTVVANITGTSRTLTNLQPDTEYCFYVRQECGATDGSSSYAGPICFRTLLPLPANDDPCGAVALTVNSAGQVTTGVTSTTLGATTTSVGGISGQLPACSPALAPKDVWFRFTLPAGTTTFDVNVTGNPASMLRLYTAANCSTSFQMVACQAASGSGVSVGRRQFTGLTAGTTYYVAVSGYGSADTQGAFTIGGALAGRGQLPGGELTVHPNPVNGQALTLKLTGAGTASVARASMVNTLGQVVREQQVAVRNGVVEQQLSVEGLSHGLYTLRLQVGEHTISQKVVVE